MLLVGTFAIISDISGTSLEPRHGLQMGALLTGLPLPAIAVICCSQQFSFAHVSSPLVSVLMVPYGCMGVDDITSYQRGANCARNAGGAGVLVAAAARHE